MPVTCKTCGKDDNEGLKTALIRAYMRNQDKFRDLKESGKMSKEVVFYYRGRNDVLQELMESFGLRRDVKKPLALRSKSVNQSVNSST